MASSTKATPPGYGKKGKSNLEEERMVLSELVPMLRRPITDRLDFQANLINLTNKFYIDQPHPNHLIPGEGFNAQFGLNMHF